MDNDNARLCLEKFERDISPQQAKEIKEQLKSVPDERAQSLRGLKTKSAEKTVMLSSIFGLFGGGSFYLGQLKRGLCKVLFNVIVPFAVAMIFLFWLAPTNRMYAEQGSLYSSFSTSKTEDLADFEYNYSLDDSEPAEGEASGDAQGSSNEADLSDRGFTENINSAATLYNQAFTSLKSYFDDIPGKFSDISALFTEITEKYTAINTDFADFDNSLKTEGSTTGEYDFADYSQAVQNIYTALVTVFPAIQPDEQESEPEEEPVKTLSEKLAEVAGKEAVKSNESLVKDINSLIAAINGLTDMSLNAYVSCLGSIDIQQILDSSILTTHNNQIEVLNEKIGEFKTLYGDKCDLNELTALIQSIKSYADSCAEIGTEITAAKGRVDALAGSKLQSSVDSWKELLTPEVKENAENTPKGFAALLTSVLDGLDGLTLEAEETLIPEVQTELNQLSDNYASSGLEATLASVYEERTPEGAEQPVTVNLIAEYETALKSFINANYNKSSSEANKNLASLSGSVGPFNSAVETIADDATHIDQILNSAVFENSLYLVCSHTTETLLQYYAGRPINLYAENMGENLLMYYICVAPKTEADSKLGITDTLYDYYCTSQSIMLKVMTNEQYMGRIGSIGMATLGSIGEDLSGMASEINSLNSLTSDKVYGWRLTSELLTALFATYLAIDLIVIVAYWVFEVFRDREKCYNMNYDLICKALSIK